VDDVGGITKGIDQNGSHALSFGNRSRQSGGLSARSGRTYEITAKWQLRVGGCSARGLAQSAFKLQRKHVASGLGRFRQTT